MAIRWLLDAYQSLQASRETLMIVPINISLDRIYESANLATEMINGKREYYTLFSFLDKMWRPDYDIIGDCYVKHMEPIHLRTYLQGILADINELK